MDIKSFVESFVRRCYTARMARPLRIEYPGALYHVMNRGLARRATYRASWWNPPIIGIGWWMGCKPLATVCT